MVLRMKSAHGRAASDVRPATRRGAHSAAAQESDDSDSDISSAGASDSHSGSELDSDSDGSDDSDDSETDSQEEEEDVEPEELSFAERLQRGQPRKITVTAAKSREGTLGSDRNAQKSAPNASRRGAQSKDEEDIRPLLRRASKDAPVMMASHKPVGRFRQVVKLKQKVRRDPRFDENSGTLNMDLFEKSYSFLSEVKQKELENLEKRLTKAKKPELKREIEKEMQVFRTKEAARKDAARLQEIKREWRKREAANVAEGKKKKAYFLKDSEARRLATVDKLRNLSDKQLDKRIEKKRKREAGRNMAPVSARSAAA